MAFMKQQRMAFFMNGILLFPASFSTIPEFVGIHVCCYCSSLFTNKSQALVLEEVPVESMMHCIDRLAALQAENRSTEHFYKTC